MTYTEKVATMFLEQKATIESLQQKLQAAEKQTAELQQEVERLKLAIIEIGNHLCEGNYIAAYRYLQSINPQQDETGR